MKQVGWMVTLVLAVGLVLAGAAWCASPAQPEPNPGPDVLSGGSAANMPMAVLPEKVYTFPKALDGDSIVHEYVVENKGTGTLKIERVKTG